MTNVKVVQQTNQQTDRAKTIFPRYRYQGHKKRLWCIKYDYFIQTEN